MTTKNRAFYALLLVLGLSFIYMMDHFTNAQILGAFWKWYGLPTLLWGIFAFLVTRLPRKKAGTKPKFRALLRWLSLVLAAINIIMSYAVGLVAGLGKSPYDLSFKGILANTFHQTSIILGMEFARAWFLNTSSKKRPVLGVFAISLAFSFLGFPINRFLGSNNAKETVIFLGGTYLPTLMENVVASYLAFWGGAAPAVIYRGLLQAAHRLLPVLPNFNWITNAFIGTCIPAFGLSVAQQIISAELSKRNRTRNGEENPLGWLTTGAFCVLFAWFSVGVFSYFPTAIVSGSMLPNIGIGDVVIVKKEPPDEIGIGDVIQFKQDGARIAHRVIQIDVDYLGNKTFWTKGDANQNRDFDPVMPEQIVGKIVYTIPKAGLLAVWVRSRDISAPQFPFHLPDKRSSPL